MLRRIFLAVAVLALAFPAYGQGKPQAGTDYVAITPPQNTDTGSKIEVLEFFWYRCPHCYSLEPALAAWLKKLPSDAQFRRLPVVFNEEWAIDARIFYALEALGEVERLHAPLFDAIHKQGGVNQKGQAYLWRSRTSTWRSSRARCARSRWTASSSAPLSLPRRTSWRVSRPWR
jgi:hypothetical protein